ncbi:MAG: helix-turn-helix transcriptional regulator [Candidatus Marinimicrobia bacterium]|jgi:transcriptional regulator with XRE-family HTH domain|nr:helix-turn-helix transcriptional regulator [Candidatus Neomarinimicrobiota bacterium]|tara:strand:+ start:166 stop:507 length:342 start_codon:yes stop_codon:yes gene_type:complete
MSKLLLGKLIRKLRKQKGLSLRQLAEKVSVSFVNIAHIENGRIATSEEVIKELAKALDYDVDKLLAAADSVNEDIKNIIKKLPTAVPEFLRTAKNLTEKEWKDLTEQIKNKKQ